MQLPPAQLQSTPVFQFSASRQMTKPRSARHRFKTHAIAGPSKETVRTTVTDTDTQTMTVHSIKLRKQIMRRINELHVKNNIETGQTPTESRRKREVVTGHTVE